MPNNNFHTTNCHNVHVDGSTFRTNIVRFDQFQYALLGCNIVELHGLLFITAMKTDQNGKEYFITYRVPLVGAGLEPWEAHDETNPIVILPHDKVLIPESLYEYIKKSEENISLYEALSLLSQKGFSPNIDRKKELTVTVCALKTIASISCPWFRVHLDTQDNSWFNPLDILPVVNLFCFLFVPFNFVPANNSDPQDCALAEDLTRLMRAYSTNGFMRGGGVVNDGTYTYTRDLGRIPMTREEFCNKFPDACIMSTE